MREYPFSVCLMNPPYDKNKHLKFLEKVIKLADNAVSIQPVRWLQDPFASSKRSTLRQYMDLAQHIHSIDVINDGAGTFDIDIFSDLGIYVMSPLKTSFDYNDFWKQYKTPTQVSIIEKMCYSNDKHISDVIESNRNDGIRVLIALIGGNRGTLPTYKDFAYAIDGKVDGHDWTKMKNFGGYVKAEGSKIPCSIRFDTEQEAVNFYNSYQRLTILKGLCKLTIQQPQIQVARLPFFDDYTKPITSEWVKHHFKLTDDEVIELERLGKLSYKDKL